LVRGTRYQPEMEPGRGLEMIIDTQAQQVRGQPIGGAGDREGAVRQIEVKPFGLGRPMLGQADFTAQPVAIGSIGIVNLGWLRGVRLVRALADFNPPGLNVAATSTFGDASQAAAAIAGIHALDGWLAVLAPALGGARIQNLQVDAVGADVTSKFAVDGASVAALLGLGTYFISPRGGQTR